MNELDEAWNEFNAAAPVEEAVAEEATAENTDEAAAHTEESADVEVETGEEASEEVETQDESEPEESTESADDDFQDLLDDIPTPEQLLAKHNRIPQATKDELVNLANQWREEREFVSKIGGKEGVEVLAPVASLLQSAEPTEDVVNAAFGSMFAANPIASTVMAANVAEFFLSDEAKGKEIELIGNKILENTFGATKEHIRKLLTLEKAGYVNVDSEWELLQEEGQGSTLFEKQQSEINALKQQLQEKEDLIRNPEKILQKDQVDATRELENDFTAKIEEAIVPFAERGRWGKDSALSKLVKTAVIAELKEDPAYKGAVKYVQQSGYKNGDAIPFSVSTALNTLVNKAKARFDNSIREVNAQLKSRTETSLTAQVKQKVERTKPKSETVVERDSGIYNTSPDLDELFRQYRNSVSA